jgi:glycolate oxidase iron-sulfur subunit
MGARGRLELVSRFLSGDIEYSERLERLIFSCLMCGACDKSCPRGVPLTAALFEARRRIFLKGRSGLPYPSVIKYACNRPAAAYGALRFLAQTNLLPLLSGFRPFREISELGLAIPENRFKQDVSVFRTMSPRGRVALFTGCSVDFLYPGMGSAFVQVMNAMNLEVVISKQEACCGAPLLHMGLRDEAARLAERNLDLFGNLKVDAVIGLCPTCVHFIKDVYKDLLGEGIDNATDISGFLIESGGCGELRACLSGSGKIMYHDPCHSLNYQGSPEQPREILRLLGARLEEPAEKGCCGMGGGVSLLQPDVSKALCGKRAEALQDADMIVTSCPNCVTQLRRMIRQRPVRHLIELLPEGFRGKRQ